MSDRRVYDGKLVKVDMARFSLPGGRQVELEIIRHPGAAAVVPFVSGDEVLLLDQYRFAAEGQLWEVPAGKIDPGETPETCAARELEEEAGHRAGRLEHLASVYTTPGFTDEVIHLYSAHELQDVGQSLEPDEQIRVVPMPFSQAIEMVYAGTIRDAKTALALLHAAHRAR